jgi:hypothetical protein
MRLLDFRLEVSQSHVRKNNTGHTASASTIAVTAGVDPAEVDITNTYTQLGSATDNSSSNSGSGLLTQTSNNPFNWASLAGAVICGVLAAVLYVADRKRRKLWQLSFAVKQ